MAISWKWKIEYTDPAIGTPADITELCEGFTITASIMSFVREMNIDVIDRGFYDSIDFTVVPEDPPIEIFTKLSGVWISQGRFFLERPLLTAGVHVDEARGIWGRSITAKLSEPFADKVTKVWESDTTFFAIAGELCTLCGLSFDEAKSDATDFTVFAKTLESENRYPADILSELCVIAGALLSCDRIGDLYVREIDYSPSAGDASITDDDMVISETPIYPSFGNRVKLIPTGSAGGYQIELMMGDPCISARMAFQKGVFARVVDAGGSPVKNGVVDWRIEYDGGVTGLAKLKQTASNTKSVRFYREKKQADSLYRLRTELPATTILGIYGYQGASRWFNYAAGGYTLEGDTVILSSPLKYCDQTVLVDYEVDGVAVNYLIPNGTGPLGQTAVLTASIAGQDVSQEIYINNGCQCPVTLDIRANPGSLSVGESSDILVYAEQAGGPVVDGRHVFLQQSVKIGVLKSLVLILAAIAINNEQAESGVVTAGVTQCQVSMYPSSVYGVFLAGTDSDGKQVRVGGNLYASHQGKVIELSQTLPVGTQLLVAYYAYGTAMTYFKGGKAGTTRITALMEGNTEQPVSASTDITVSDKNTPLTNSYTPPTWAPYGALGPVTNNLVALAGAGNEGAIEVPCTQKCQEQYPPGSAQDDCIDTCVANNDPGGKSDDGEGFDETNDEPSCDGATCGEGESCCNSGADYGCFPSDQCTGAAPYMPPDDCESKCADELDRHGTTEIYNEGSMRPLSEIVVEDFGYTKGSDDGYWEKYAELAAEAETECLEDCQACEEAEDLVTDAPETSEPDSEILILISGGKGPYTSALKSGESNGFEMVGSGDEIVLSQAADGCGAGEIEITDACGTTITVGIRSTNGEWVSLPEYTGPGSSVPCLLEGEHNYDWGMGYYNRIQGKYKLLEDNGGGGGGSPPCSSIDCSWISDCMAYAQPCITPVGWPDSACSHGVFTQCSKGCIICDDGDGNCSSVFLVSAYRYGFEWRCS